MYKSDKNYNIGILGKVKKSLLEEIQKIKISAIIKAKITMKCRILIVNLQKNWHN